MQSETDKKNSESLISKGIAPDVVAGLSADRRQALAERLRPKAASDRGVLIWLVFCFAIIAMTALLSIMF